MTDHGGESLARRTVLTLALVGAALLLFHVPLAGIDRSALGLDASTRQNLSIGALGIMPVISAYLLVEVVALSRAKWRALRNSGALGRAKLSRVAHVLALVLAAFQAFGVTRYMEGIDVAGLDFVMEPSLGFRVVTVCTLVAGTALLMLIAAAIQRFGLGNGYSVLIASGVCLHLSDIPEAATDLPPALKVALVAGGLAVVALFAIVLGLRNTHPALSPADPYRDGAATEQPSTLPIVRPLPCGIVPLTVAASALTLPLVIANLVPGVDASALPIASADGYELWGLALVLGLTPLLARWFHAPQRIAALRVRALGKRALGASEAAVRLALSVQVLISMVVLGALWWLAAWLGRTTNVGLALFELTVLPAVILDLATELGARRRLGRAVAVGALHRVWEVDVALELLQQNGIQAAPRTLHHRMLLQFFGPHLPVELLVQPRHAKRARKLLAKLPRAS